MGPATGTARHDASRPDRTRLRWSQTGTSQLRLVPVADPELVRGLDTGQAAYLYRGGVTFTQVKRLVAGPAALLAEPAEVSAPTRAAQPAGTRLPAEPALAAAPLPDVTSFLDEVFGSWP